MNIVWVCWHIEGLGLEVGEGESGYQWYNVDGLSASELFDIISTDLEDSMDCCNCYPDYQQIKWAIIDRPSPEYIAGQLKYYRDLCEYGQGMIVMFEGL